MFGSKVIGPSTKADGCGIPAIGNCARAAEPFGSPATGIERHGVGFGVLATGADRDFNQMNQAPGFLPRRELFAAGSGDQRLELPHDPQPDPCLPLDPASGRDETVIPAFGQKIVKKFTNSTCLTFGACLGCWREAKTRPS